MELVEVLFCVAAVLVFVYLGLRETVRACVGYGVRRGFAIGVKEGYGWAKDDAVDEDDLDDAIADVLERLEARHE